MGDAKRKNKVRGGAPARVPGARELQPGVTVLPGAGGLIATVDSAALETPAETYEANWFEVEQVPPSLGFDTHFGATIPFTPGLATILTVRCAGDFFFAPSVEELRGFGNSLRKHLKDVGAAEGGVPEIDKELIAQRPPKSHLVHASAFRPAFWENDGRIAFYYMDPAVRGGLRQPESPKGVRDKLIVPVVTVRLNSLLFLRLVESWLRLPKVKE